MRGEKKIKSKKRKMKKKMDSAEELSSETKVPSPWLKPEGFFSEFDFGVSNFLW